MIVKRQKEVNQGRIDEVKKPPLTRAPWLEIRRNYHDGGPEKKPMLARVNWQKVSENCRLAP